VRGTVGEPLLDAQNPALSPAMDRIAVSAVAHGATLDRALDIFVVDSRNGSRYQLIDDLGNDRYARWRADGVTIVFSTWNSGIRHGRERDADGQNPPRLLVRSFLHGQPSHDDRYLLMYFDSVDYIERGSDERRTFIEGGDGWQFALSPDSRYVAYGLGGGGIRLRRFPAGGGLVTVSSLEGKGLRWSRDGAELFFWANEDFMTVPIDLTGPQPVVGIPQKLFSSASNRVLSGDDYDVGADGRFLMLRDISDSSNAPVPTEIQVIQNWFMEIRREAGAEGAP
jgi:hypothetical protein